MRRPQTLEKRPQTTDLGEESAPHPSPSTRLRAGPLPPLLRPEVQDYEGHEGARVQIERDATTTPSPFRGEGGGEGGQNQENTPHLNPLPPLLRPEVQDYEGHEGVRGSSPSVSPAPGGMTLDMSQAQALANALAGLSSEWLALHGRQARERAVKMFSTEAVIGQYVEYYKEIVRCGKSYELKVES